MLTAAWRKQHNKHECTFNSYVGIEKTPAQSEQLDFIIVHTNRLHATASDVIAPRTANLHDQSHAITAQYGGRLNTDLRMSVSLTICGTGVSEALARGAQAQSYAHAHTCSEHVPCRTPVWRPRLPPGTSHTDRTSGSTRDRCRSGSCVGARKQSRRPRRLGQSRRAQSSRVVAGQSRRAQSSRVKAGQSRRPHSLRGRAGQSRRARSLRVTAGQSRRAQSLRARAGQSRRSQSLRWRAGQSRQARRRAQRLGSVSAPPSP